MGKRLLGTTILCLASLAGMALADDPPGRQPRHDEGDGAKDFHFKPEEWTSDGSVTVAGARIDYQAVIGTLVVHPKGWDDVRQEADREGKHLAEEGAKPEQGPVPEAAMSYVAYFKRGAKPESRPVTFLYNGGPGSATVWLHMGAFGPKRVVTPDDTHAPAAPYPVVNNDESLLDASDLVFIDAPGTGFGRIAGKDKEKAFFGVDQDSHAFAEFITQFLAKYGRWNSPKYLYGESYGTTRSAALVNLLESERSVDVNGVLLLSQILNFDADAGASAAELNPGVELPYELILPTYAATAWYHKKLPGERKPLKALIDEAEQFAMTDYALALQKGATLAKADRDAIAAKLHELTGLPVDYILKADLRITAGEFEKTLQADTDTTTGRLDSRFSGPTLDPLSKEAGYDPQSAAIRSAYVSAFNDYARHDLKYGGERAYRPSQPLFRTWDYKHQAPGEQMPRQGAANVMPDLANAMKLNPNLRVQLNAGYYDLATPFYEGVYEMQHLPIPEKLEANIEIQFYESGHMVYAHEASLKALHDNAAAFIRKGYKAE